MASLVNMADTTVNLIAFRFMAKVGINLMIRIITVAELIRELKFSEEYSVESLTKQLSNTP